MRVKSVREPGFLVTFDESLRLLIIEKWGFWSRGTHAAYLEELRLCELKAHQAGNCQGILLDNRDFPVQSRAISDALAEQVSARAARAVRTAIVFSSSLAKLQAARIASAPHISIFTDAITARDWLVPPSRSAAA